MKMVIKWNNKKGSLGNRFFNILNAFKWIIIGILVLLTFYFGYIGAERQFAAIGIVGSFADKLYVVIQCFKIVPITSPIPIPLELEVARALGQLVLSFSLILIFFSLFYEQITNMRIRFSRNHVVICGLDIAGSILVKIFREEGYRVIIITNDNTQKDLETCREYGAFTIIGDATDPAILKKSQIAQAKYLVAVSKSDGFNAEVAGQSFEIVSQGRGSPLTCFVHIIDPKLCNFLRAREFGSTVENIFRMEFFNIYQVAGEAMFSYSPPFPIDELHPPLSHMCVIGAGKMGAALTVHSAKMWRNTYGRSGQRLTITLIDRNSKDTQVLLFRRYPSIQKYCSIEALVMEIHSKDFLEGKFLSDQFGRGEVTSIYICLSDISLGLFAALELNHQLQGKDIPIVVRTSTEKGIPALINQMGKGIHALPHLITFPEIESSYSVESILNTIHNKIAQSVHNTYVGQQEKLGYTPSANPSMVPWKELSEELKNANRRQADDIINKLRSIDCDIELMTDWDEPLFKFEDHEIEMLAINEHDRWIKERTQSGWIYGPSRDDTKKIHPSLVPWIKLPDTEKEKDRTTIRTLPTILAMVDLKIVRRVKSVR